MMLEVDLIAFLLSVQSITTLVNGSQIYGLKRPQGLRPLPELLIARTSTVRQVKFCGTDSLVNTDLQIDSYGLELAQTLTLARSVRKTLVDFKGMMADTYVDQVTLTNEFPVEDPDPGIVRMTQLYNFWYVEE